MSRDETPVFPPGLTVADLRPELAAFACSIESTLREVDAAGGNSTAKFAELVASWCDACQAVAKGGK